MKYLVVVAKSENGFGAHGPDLPGCLGTGQPVRYDAGDSLVTIRNPQEFWISIMRTMTVLLLMVLSGSLMAAPRGFAMRDLVMLDRVSDPQVSPDGRCVAFTLRETDRDNAKGVSGICLLDLTQPTAGPCA